MIKIEKLSGGYNGKEIVHKVSFSVEKGQLFGILGPNGSGKSTLLKMMSGILPFNSGNIYIKQKPLQQYKIKELAKVIAVLPQISNQEFSYTVKETVSLGRYAHQKGFFRSWTDDDEKIVRYAMEQTGVIQFQDASLTQLSGGERQRVYLAQALAQQPDILLLDEPTNHLDLSFQKELLDLLKKMANECGLTVISILHDINLAGLYCDQLLLMKNGQTEVVGTPSEVLKEKRIEAVYQTNVQGHPHPQCPKPQMSILPNKIESEKERIEVTETHLIFSNHMMALESPIPLKTLATGGLDSAWGWYQRIINPTFTECKNVSHQLMKGDGYSVFIVVCVDIHYEFQIWVIINGVLTDQAFVQAVVAATEGKMNALYGQKISNSKIGMAHIVIAATQRGESLSSQEINKSLHSLISQGVCECTHQVISRHCSETLQHV